MTKRIDGRTLRGLVRRAVYSEACRLLTETAPQPPATATTPGLTALYYDERRELLEWLRQRGRGVLRVPPGGVVSGGGK